MLHGTMQNAGKSVRRFFLRRRVLLLAVCLLSTAAAQTRGTLNRYTYDGTVGAARIGMVLFVSSGGEVSTGHYFYARYLTDIPLTATRANGRLELHEAGGGIFRMAFKGNGSENGQPLNFSNSIGLEGTWTKQGKTVPVSLTGSSMDMAGPNDRWYADVTSETDAAFEARVQGFRRAALAGNHAGTAQFVDFPLRVNRAGRHRMVGSAAQLSAQWSTIFTPQCLEALRKAVAHDMFVRNGQVMLGDGVVWFGPKGAQSINVP